jgi:hypothetical protein
LLQQLRIFTEQERILALEQSVSERQALSELFRQFDL